MSLFLPPAGSPRSAFPTDPHGLGTPTYSPPEFVRPLPSTFSYASDVFSLGVTLGVLVSGREPFEGMRAVERMWLVGNAGWYEWEEAKRSKELERELHDLHAEGGSGTLSSSASLHNLSLGGDQDPLLSRQGSLRSLRSERDLIRRRSLTTTTSAASSIRKSGSSDSLKSLASLGGGRDWESIIHSLVVDAGEEGDEQSSSTSHLSQYALPPLPTSASNSPTHSRSGSLDSCDDSNTFASSTPRSYPGTSTPSQTFLDRVSIVPPEVRELLKRMTSPREDDRPSAVDVLAQLDELADKYSE